MKKGYIRVGHLVYIIIIAVIVLAFFLVIAFGNSESANTTMGTASTVSSLILSVIAIVLSLIDVTGQKQSMVDLKETADQLHKTNTTALTLNKELINKLEELDIIKDQMVGAVTESAEWRKDLVSKLESIVAKGDYKSEDLNKIIDEAQKTNFERRHPIRTTLKALQIIRANFKSGDKINADLFRDVLQKELKLPEHLYAIVKFQLTSDNYVNFCTTVTGDYVVVNRKVFDDE